VPTVPCRHLAYQENEQLMEYAPGGHFKQKERLSLEAARFYLASIVLALEYLTPTLLFTGAWLRI